MSFVVLAFRTEPREFFFFSLAINTRPSCWLGITLRRGLSTSCTARSSLSSSFFPLPLPSKTRGYSYLVRGGDKKWHLSRIGPFENLPIVRRRAERFGFSGVRLGHISAGVSFPLAKRSTEIRSLRRPFDLRRNISERLLMGTRLDVFMANAIIARWLFRNNAHPFSLLHPTFTRILQKI